MKKPLQALRILQFLRENGSITRADAFVQLGIVELPARICNLEAKGYQFGKAVETALNRYGDKVHFTRYTLLREGEQIG